MSQAVLKRRAVLKSGILACGCGISAGQAASASQRAIRLGAPVFNAPDDPEQLALAHRMLGYRAAYCPAVKLTDAERIRDIRKAFEKHGVVIAEVGRWCNLMDHDPEKRKRNIERVTEGLALAEELGALCCVDIAGSFNRKVWYGPHPDNLSQRFFDAAVANARKIIDAVRPKRAKFCYEMMSWSLPDSPEAYLKMLEAIERPAFGVHLDPCNIINSPRRFYSNGRVIDDCFDKLGQWVVSCHAKDLKWVVEMNVHFVEVRPGTGSIDYKTYLSRLAELPHRPPLMIEHLPNAEEYAKAADYITGLGRSLGIEF